MSQTATRRAVFTREPTARSVLQDWHDALAAFDVRAVLVLGPDGISANDSREVVAVYPEEFRGPGITLAHSTAFGLPWRASAGSLVAYKNLSGNSEQIEPWAAAWLEGGALSMVRTELPLPLGRAFEAFVFTGRHLADRREASEIVWSAMNIWPTIREQVIANRFDISERERQTLLLLAEGHTSKEAARQLGCTERTVNFHLQNIAEKLNARNKASVIQRACSLGVI